MTADVLRYLIQAALMLLLGLSIPVTQFITPFQHLKTRYGLYVIVAIYAAAIITLEQYDTARRCVQLVAILWLVFTMARLAKHLPDYQQVRKPPVRS